MQPLLCHQACVSPSLLAMLWSQNMPTLGMCTFLSLPDPLISAEYELSMDLDRGH